MKARKGEWFSLSWDIIDYYDPLAFHQHMEAPRFLYAEEDSAQIESILLNRYDRLRLVSIFLTSVFVTEGHGIRVPTHYRVGEFMPGDKPSYDAWLSKYHQMSYGITEQIHYKEALQQQKIFLEHTAKVIRHDMHSGINTYLPRGLKGLLRNLPEEVIEEHKLQSYIQMLEEGLSYTQKVYWGVHAFTNLIKEDVCLEKQVHDLKKILDNFVSGTAYSDKVQIADLVSVPVQENLFCIAIENLIKGGLQFNEKPNKWVKIYMESPDILCVQDNGVGLSKEQFLLYCKPYVRIENAKPKGLELNIAVAIIEQHGFGIEPERLEVGTVFRINLDVNRQHTLTIGD